MKHIIIKSTLTVFFTFGIFSCGASKNTASVPAAVTQKEIQKDSEQTTLKPITIIDSRVRINKNYELQIFAANNWHKFLTILPKMDLTQHEFDMATTSNMNAQLKCLNSRCSKSKISLQAKSSQHQLFIEQSKSIPMGGEFLKNCEVPLFFDYEFDELIGDNADLKKEIKSFAGIDKIEITSAQIDTATESHEMVNVSRRVRFRFSNGGKTVFTTDNPSVEAANISLMAKPSYGRYLKEVSLSSVGQRSDRRFDSVKFHFPLSNGDEICYHMSIVSANFVEILKR